MRAEPKRRGRGTGSPELALAAVAIAAAVAVGVVVWQLADRPPAPSATAATSGSAAPSGAAPTASGGLADAGAGRLAWRFDVAAALGDSSAWVASLVDASADTWLASVSVVDAATGEERSQVLVLDATAGTLRAPAGSADLPGQVVCANRLLDGRAICLVGGEIRRVDPASGQLDGGALGGGIVGSAVTVTADGLVVVGGLAADSDRPAVAAVTADGVLAWSSELGVADCFVAGGAQSGHVVERGGALQVAVGEVQALVAPATGQVLAAFCAQMAVTDDGAIGLMDSQGVAGALSGAYVDAAGVTRPICDFGPAQDIMAVRSGGEGRFAVVDEAERLRLVAPQGCRSVWEQGELLGRAVFQGHDSEAVYYAKVGALTAVALESGTERWTAPVTGGASFRAAFVDEAWIVLMTSAEVRGIRPSDGAVAWVVEEFDQAAWYWEATVDDPVRAVALLDPARSQISRLDLTG
ncbi:MAG: hypothetical protein LBD97_02400 [Bifidobacteriaceae bacterium]|jgi:hypothetical protein|nr:hypothetical protein [Bifidobacteriaceae bacterium]